MIRASTATGGAVSSTQRLISAARPLGLGAVVRPDAHDRGRARRGHGPEGLDPACAVVGNQVRRRRHDLWRRPEVLPEGANAPASVDALEGVEPAHIGAPPAVDGLVVIGPECHGAVGPCQLFDQGVLEGAEVLGLVDEDRPEARAQSVAESGIAIEERDRLGQEVREIEGVGLAAPGAIGGQQPAEICRGSCVRRAALGVLEGLGEAPGIPGEGEIPAELLDQAAGIRAVEDGERRRASDGARLAPEQPRAEAVECPRPDVARLAAERLLDAADQLRSGGAREGEGEDLTGAKALMDEPVDPVGQDPGLAAAGTAGEQNGAGRMGHRGTLGRGERGEVGGESHCRWAGLLWRVQRRKPVQRCELAAPSPEQWSRVTAPRRHRRPECRTRDGPAAAAGHPVVRPTSWLSRRFAAGDPGVEGDCPGRPAAAAQRVAEVEVPHQAQQIGPLEAEHAGGAALVAAGCQDRVADERAAEREEALVVGAAGVRFERVHGASPDGMGTARYACRISLITWGFLHS